VQATRVPPQPQPRRNRELTNLLVTRRSKLRPEGLAISAGRGAESGLRQRDVAGLAAVSERYYAQFERGQVAHPSPQLLDAVARALQMGEAERSTLYVLARGDEPPPAISATAGPLRVRPPLQELVRRLAPNPAAIMDETWTLLTLNRAVTEWFGECSDIAVAGKANVVLYLFTPEAEQRVINLGGERRAAVAGLRYQYARHLANPRFDAVVARLLAASAEARALWQEYALAAPPLVHRHQICHPQHGVVQLDGVLTSLPGRLWLIAMMLPQRFAAPPRSHLPPARWGEGSSRPRTDVTWVRLTWPGAVCRRPGRGGA
jgi:transcriptional regulator with XRE-family HTH domain